MEEKIPLDEAVQRGLIRCAGCGVQGAEVRAVGGKNHFLCPACARRGRPLGWLMAGLGLSAAVLIGYFVVRGLRHVPPQGPLPPGVVDEGKEIKRLMQMGRYRDARDRIKGLLEPLPKDPVMNLLMGQCLMRLQSYEEAIGHFRTSMESDPDAREVVTPWIGIACQKIGRAAEARPYLEQASPIAAMDALRRGALVECYLDLERYEDALKALPADAKDDSVLWVRHRALLYQGKKAEAEALVKDRGAETDPLWATQLREEGDFAAARKVLEAALSRVEAHTAPWHRFKRAELALAIESGEPERLDGVAAELASAPDMNVQGEALYSRAIGHLLSGRKDAARAAAWEFIARTEKDFSPLRLERLMMRHLAGELKDADVEAEAKRVSRFHANELYWYLAVATGDRAWAEKALQSTPGRNYPYHSIRRILGK